MALMSYVGAVGAKPLAELLVALVFWLDWLAALFLLLAAPLIPLFMALVGMHAERISQRHVLQLEGDVNLEAGQGLTVSAERI